MSACVCLPVCLYDCLCLPACLYDCLCLYTSRYVCLSVYLNCPFVSARLSVRLSDRLSISLSTDLRIPVDSCSWSRPACPDTSRCSNREKTSIRLFPFRSSVLSIKLDTLLNRIVNPLIKSQRWETRKQGKPMQIQIINKQTMREQPHGWCRASRGRHLDKSALNEFKWKCWKLYLWFLLDFTRVSANKKNRNNDNNNEILTVWSWKLS